MAPTSRDLASFTVLLAIAGILPVVVLPGADIVSLFGVLQGTVQGLPLEHFGLAVILAVFGAVWADTNDSAPPRADADIGFRD